jgi:hypothetical protein
LLPPDNKSQLLPSYRKEDSRLELTSTRGNEPPITIRKGETVMGSVGKKDKGNKEQRKKPKLNIKEKRKQKNEKKNK